MQECLGLAQILVCPVDPLNIQIWQRIQFMNILPAVQTSVLEYGALIGKMKKYINFIITIITDTLHPHKIPASTQPVHVWEDPPPFIFCLTPLFGWIHFALVGFEYSLLTGWLIKGGS